MDSVREQIEEALQRSKIHKETVYGILRQIADAIEPPAPAPETPKKKVVIRVVKKKVAE